MIKLYYALFFDDNGEFIKRIKFKRKDRVFTYERKKYNVEIQNATFYPKRFLIFFKSYFYFYNINNPSPLSFEKVVEPVINPELYNIMLETKVARDLNDLHKDFLGKLLTPRNIFIGIILVIAIIYFAQGGSIT